MNFDEALARRAVGMLVEYINTLEAMDDMTRLYAGRGVVRDMCARFGIDNPLGPPRSGLYQPQPRER